MNWRRWKSSMRNAWVYATKNRKISKSRKRSLTARSGNLYNLSTLTCARCEHGRLSWYVGTKIQKIYSRKWSQETSRNEQTKGLLGSGQRRPHSPRKKHSALKTLTDLPRASDRTGSERAERERIAGEDERSGRTEAGKGKPQRSTRFVFRPLNHNLPWGFSWLCMK